MHMNTNTTHTIEEEVSVSSVILEILQLVLKEWFFMISKDINSNSKAFTTYTVAVYIIIQQKI